MTNDSLSQSPVVEAASAFRPSGDLWCLKGGNYTGPAVLLINPDAPIDAVLQTAEARLLRLLTSMRAWSFVNAEDAEEVNVVKLMEALEPAAEEVLFLLQSCTARLEAKLHREATHG